MKRLALIFCLVLQLLMLSSAQAWSPLDFKRSFPGFTEHCQIVVAASDDSEGTKNEEQSEEEEEPDCD